MTTKDVSFQYYYMYDLSAVVIACSYGELGEHYHSISLVKNESNELIFKGVHGVDTIDIPSLPDMSEEEIFQYSLVHDHNIPVQELKAYQEEMLSFYHSLVCSPKRIAVLELIKERKHSSLTCTSQYFKTIEIS